MYFSGRSDLKIPTPFYTVQKITAQSLQAAQNVYTAQRHGRENWNIFSGRSDLKISTPFYTLSKGSLHKVYKVYKVTKSRSIARWFRFFMCFKLVLNTAVNSILELRKSLTFRRFPESRRQNSVLKLFDICQHRADTPAPKSLIRPTPVSTVIIFIERTKNNPLSLLVTQVLLFVDAFVQIHTEFSPPSSLSLV